MPNQRAKGQKLLNIAMNGEAIAAMDTALRQLGVSNRSDFIREAIRMKIASLGIDIPESAFAPHPRFGSNRNAKH